MKKPENLTKKYHTTRHNCEYAFNNLGECQPLHHLVYRRMLKRQLLSAQAREEQRHREEEQQDSADEAPPSGEEGSDMEQKEKSKRRIQLSALVASYVA